MMKFNKWKLIFLCFMIVFTGIASFKLVHAMDTKAKALPKKGELQIQKLDEDTSLPIEGASLKLVEDTTNTVVEEWVSDTSIKTIEVELNKTYRLVEEQPAKGYEKSEDVVIQPDKDIIIDINGVQNNVPTKIYKGLRNNSIRYVTDGTDFQVVYCLNHDFYNPNNADFLNTFNIDDPQYPHYLHYSLRGMSDDMLYEYQKVKFNKNGMANLLLAAYPNNIDGLQEKYSLTNDAAYAKTQSLIDNILAGNLNDQTVGNYAPEQSKYYNELLDIYKNPSIPDAEAYIDLYAWIPKTGTPPKVDPDNDRYQMLAGITNFYAKYNTKVVSKSKKAPTISVSVEKVWDDTIQADHTHDEVNVQLYENGVASGNPVVLNASNGWKHTWDNLLQSSTWTVDEVQVKDGYVKKVDSQQNNYTITNTQIVGSLEIIKEDADTKHVLQGAIFEVFDEQGKSLGTITTDTQGKAQMQLAYGKYKVKEIHAPSGYQLTNKVYDFTIRQQSEKVQLTITNKKETIEEDKPVTDIESDNNDTNDENEVSKDESTPNNNQDEILNENESLYENESNDKDDDVVIEENESSNDNVLREEETKNEQQEQSNREENTSKNNEIKKEEKQEKEKETVQTSDTTKIYIWWLILTCSMLIVTCGCKYNLNKNKR